MLFGYCVRRAGDPPPPAELRGVEGREVEVVQEADLVLWISRGPLPAPTLEHLQAHDRVLRAALRTATPLPIRYGAASFAGDHAAREALRDRAAAFADSLTRLAGRVEMAVRLEWDAPPVAAGEAVPGEPVRSGREYLERRRSALGAEAARRARAGELLDQAAAHFNSFQMDCVRHVVADRQIAGSLAHLVHRAEVGRYREQAERARRALADCRLVLSGPWAPYSFV